MSYTASMRILLAAAAALSSAAFGGVTVTFPNPERYKDAGRQFETGATLEAIRRHLEMLGDRYLAPSQNLSIEVHDIDLAGHTRFGFSAGFAEVRVLSGRADWPAIRMKYTLVTNGKASAPVEETVVDMDYLRGPKFGGDPTEALYFEKRMLEDWFRKRFASGSRP